MSKYLWIGMWGIMVVFFTWLYYNLFLVNDPVVRLFTWVYLAGTLTFMVPAGYYAIKQ